MPVAILFGALDAAGGLVQRRMAMPDATVLVLQGIIFVVLLVSETFYGRIPFLQPKRGGGPHMSEAELFIVLIAMIGGAIRVSTPFMFVALGECLTEKSGRINLGLEGNLVLGAMVAYAGSYHDRQPVARRACRPAVAGLVLGAMHGYICKLPKVNDIAVGIAFMSFGTGLAFFFGKPYIQPTAPRLEAIPLGGWIEQSRRSRRRCRSIRCSSSASRSRCSCGGRSPTRAGA